MPPSAPHPATLALADWPARLRDAIDDPARLDPAEAGALERRLRHMESADPDAVECLLLLMHWHYLRTEAVQALPLGEQAIAQARLLAPPDGVSPLLRRALTFQGVMRMESGHFTSALQAFTEALVLAQSMGDGGAEASVWNNLGMTLRNLARYDEALACFEHAVALSPSAGPYALVTQKALNNVASCALHLQDVPRGLTATRRAIALNLEPASAVDCLSRAVSESNATRLQLLAGDTEAARAHARLALRWGSRLDSPRTEALRCLTDGILQVHTGEAQAGLGQVRQALDIARRHLPAEVHDMLDACITAYRQVGQADVAMVFLHELQALHRDVRTAHALAQHEAHLAGLASPAWQPAPVGIDRAIMLRHGLLRGELGQREALQARVRMLEQQSVAAELHDDATGRHCYRVGRLASLLAREAGLEDDVCFLIDLAARLHDIGKLAVPDALLLKPGALTPEERAIMETHTVAGAQILARSDVPQMHVAEAIARHHHERWDGTGYPDRLAGFSIPIAARVTALADVFDALTHARPYKRAWPVGQALDEIRALRGTHFDPALTDLFLALLPRLQREVGELDAYLGAEAERSPFVQARDQLAQALKAAASLAAAQVR